MGLCVRRIALPPILTLRRSRFRFSRDVRAQFGVLLQSEARRGRERNGQSRGEREYAREGVLGKKEGGLEKQL